MNKSQALVAKDIVKTFRDGTGHEVKVLTGVDLAIDAGTVAAVIGASGSGKSTLLQILGGLDAADSGDVVIAATSLRNLNEKDLGELRNRHLGFVYQFHHLLPEFSALENVAMPLLIRRMDKNQAFEHASRALKDLGLANRLEHLPSQLSGGERQRTAIARAMVTHPTCILADEPTGNLDHDTALEVFEGFVTSARNTGTSVLIVTHDLELAERCDVIFKLENGCVHRLVKN